MLLCCVNCRLGWAVGCLHFGHAVLVNACFTELFVRFYFSLSLFVMVTSLLTAVIIVHVSLKGTLINAYPRRHMPKLLIVKVTSSSICVYNFYNLFLYVFTYRRSRHYVCFQILSSSICPCTKVLSRDVPVFTGVSNLPHIHCASSRN